MSEWFFRVEAGAGIGLGHLRRSISLAKALRRKGERCLFVTRADPAVLELIRAAGFPSEPLPNLPLWSEQELRWSLELALSRHPAGVVVDSEEPDVPYWMGWQKEGFLTVVRDDLGRRHLPVDLVINGNADAERLPYPSDPKRQFLLGLAYAVLAPEFWNRPTRPRAPEKASRLLLLSGGADGAGSLPDFLRRLDRLETDFQITVVIGPFFRNRKEIESVCFGMRQTARLVQNPSSLLPLIQEADLAVSAAGQTLYDLACAGCPALAFEAASNQAGQLAALEREGSVIRLKPDGSDLEATVERVASDQALRERMTRRGQSMIDGLGAERVASSLLTLSEKKYEWNLKP